MDIRNTAKEPTKQDYMKAQDEKLTDSLIYNIIKKIQLKETIENKYDAYRLPQVKQIPYGIGKHIHSANGIGYFLGVSGWLLYRRYKTKQALKISAFLPHAVIGLTLNQYDRYRAIMNFNPELTNQYKAYQQNTRTIIEQMKRRVSLLQIVKDSKLITLGKITQMVKYKPIY